jgi:GT2 family glycosyltransferase
MDAQRFRDEQRALRELVGERRGRPALETAGAGSTPTRATPTGEGPLVSVIVVCWNAAGVLERCIDSLLAQDYANREIVVVDDGSEDATLEIARAASERGELTLLASTRNRGCPAARNLGLDRARGEIVAFVDADGFATPSWLSELVRTFEQDPAIGGVASTVFYDDNPVVLNGAGGTVNRQGWAADLSMNESLEVARLAEEALYPMGCGMAVRREAFERVGPFDDRMLNYYDDVDYGVRLWRAGYKVAVAADAWIDHAAAVGDSPRKRLLCERHRMRVALKHTPRAALARWASWELRELLDAPAPVRLQKLRSIAWNARHAASALGARRRLRGAVRVPDRLIAPSWGDGFPVGQPPRALPRAARAGAAVDLGDPESSAQLLHGWFAPERVDRRACRWAATHAALLVRAERPVRRLRLDYAHVPVDIGGVDVQIRASGAASAPRPVWHARLPWQYIARSVENHPLRLEPGDYEVVFSAQRGWSDPPAETRVLALALSSLALAESFELAPSGIEMAGEQVEGQLVYGWYEAERSPERAYRWATGDAAAVVRVAAPAMTARLGYRFPPVSVGGLELALTPLESSERVFATRLEWRDPEWHEALLPVELAPGDYVASLRTERTWSNRDARDPSLWAENRSLGFAVSSLSFV